jgi:hypothetical protein
LVHREVFEKGESSMKPHPDLDWIKKVLADLERHRGDPQIDAFMSELAETSTERVGLQPALEPFEKAPSSLRN